MKQKGKLHIWLLLLKIFGWTLMAMALFVVGMLMATVVILRPHQLTPIVEILANKKLNADVSIAKVELFLKGHYPFLHMQVDSLTVLSRDINSLAATDRESLPCWADTLLSVDHISGGINLPKVVIGDISLSDVLIDGPEINLLTVDSVLNNYSITYPSQEMDEDTGAVPNISIKSFAITNPRNIRYANLADSVHVDVGITTARLDNQLSDTLSLPEYHIDVNTNLASPLLQFLADNKLAISCDGNIAWKYTDPYAVSIRDFNFAVSELSGTVNTDVQFDDALIVRSFDIKLNPVSVANVLELISEETKKTYDFPRGLRTDLTVGLEAQLLRSYNVDVDGLPHLNVEIEVPESYLRWRKLDLRKLELMAKIHLPGDSLDYATVDIEKLLIAGPATALTIEGDVKRMVSDPTFEGSIIGDMNLNRLPPQLTKFLEGAQVKGRLKLNTALRAAMSMLSPENFHRIRVQGTVEARNFWYASADTQTVALIPSASAKFGSNQSFTVTRQSIAQQTSGKIDSLLTASIVVDSAKILSEGISVNVSGLKLGLGAKNTAPSRDTTAIIPMGGGITMERLSLVVLDDSAMLRLRDVNGKMALQRYKGDAHLPMLTIKADIGMMSAGDPSTRMMVRKAHLDTRMFKLRNSTRTGRRDSLRRSALRDSLQAVQAKADSMEIEVMDFGTTREMRRYMRNWRMEGSLSASRARVYTTAFPLRNRIDSLQLTFNNDSIILDKTRYRAGSSSFIVSGAITNIKGAVGSTRRREPLRINMQFDGDTVDVNQLANAFFTGAANMEAKLAANIDDTSLDAEIDMENATDSVAGPLLIPVNIDAAIDIKAKDVLYSDFILHNLTGQILAYDGALNLRDLDASSNVGSINLSALYSAPTPNEMKFGMALGLKNFNIRNFLNLVPAMDSIMPMMRDLGGIVSAKIAATSDVDKEMNLVLPSLCAVINVEGDSLVFLDQETFRSISKWLLFKNKNKNMIDHMSVEMLVENSQMHLYPFVFDFDRYRLGVQGTNDLDMNYNYHVAVLKSPLPFKFGLNIKGNSEDYKVRLGRAKFNEKQTIKQNIADTTRVNLIKQFENVFRRGVRNSRFVNIRNTNAPPPVQTDEPNDTLSSADSLYFKENGLLTE